MGNSWRVGDVVTWVWMICKYFDPSSYILYGAQLSVGLLLLQLISFIHVML